MQHPGGFQGILRIYVGKKPADESLKKWMLGIR